MTVLCLNLINSNGYGPGIQVFDFNGFWTTVGFSVYAFEGIGVIMPVMEASQNREDFPRLLKWAFLLMTFFLSSFGLVCYLAYGTS